MASRTGLLPSAAVKVKDGRNQSHLNNKKYMRRSVVPTTSENQDCKTSSQGPSGAKQQPSQNSIRMSGQHQISIKSQHKAIISKDGRRSLVVPSYQNRDRSRSQGSIVARAQPIQNNVAKVYRRPSSALSHQKATISKDVGNRGLQDLQSRKLSSVKEISKKSTASSQLDRRSTPGRFLQTKKKDPHERILKVKVTPGKRNITPGKISPKRSILKRLKGAESDQKPSCTEHNESRHVTFKTKVSNQESMRVKLNDWLVSKGKTPTRCRHLMCFDEEVSAKKKKGVKLVNPNITSNLLDGQAEALEKEVRKNLFHTPETVSANTVNVQSKNEYSSSKTATPLKEKKDQQKENMAPTLVQEATSDYSEAGNLSLTDLSKDPLPHEVIELEAIHGNLKTMLDECWNLFQGGCPLENILPWLDQMGDHIPQALSYSFFYITKAKVLAGHPHQVLEVFCEAIRNKAQPVDLLATEMKNLLGPLMIQAFGLNSVTPSQNSNVPSASSTSKTLSSTPQRLSLSSSVTSASDQDNSQSSAPTSTDSTPEVRTETSRRSGSTIKFNIFSTTPLLSKTPETIAVVTPVRRSHRISNRQPTPGPGIRREVNSVSDLSEEERSKMLFKVNTAVTGE